MHRSFSKIIFTILPNILFMKFVCCIIFSSPSQLQLHYNNTYRHTPLIRFQHISYQWLLPGTIEVTPKGSKLERYYRLKLVLSSFV